MQINDLIYRNQLDWFMHQFVDIHKQGKEKR